MINFSKLIFFFTLSMGTFISISSSSWMGMWMGLEINLLSFIPLMINMNNMISTESAIKYFLIQVFASIVFLFTIIIYISKMNFFFNLMISYNENIIINSTMLMKLGAAPFHFWFPNIINGLSWMNSLILLTWQKLAPLMIISYSMMNNLLIFFIICSSLIGSLGGLNQTSLQKILVFSSINHISWLLTAIFYNNNLWSFYFFMYLVMNFSIIWIFKQLNLFNLNQIYLFNNKFPMMKFCFLINFLSLGGLPPFLGFLPKWMIIENLIKNNQLMILLLLVMTALITLFFYIRITFSAFMMSYPSFSWNYSIKKMNSLNINLYLNMFMSSSFFILIMNNFLFM